VVVPYFSHLYYKHSNNIVKKGVSIITNLVVNYRPRHHPGTVRSEKIHAAAKAMEDQVINVAFVEKGNGYSPLPAAQWVRSVLERVGYQEIQWWLDNSLAHPDWDHCVYAGVDIKGNWFLALKNWEG